MRAAAEKLSDLTSDWPLSVVEGKASVTYPVRWDEALMNGPVFVDQEFVRFYVRYEGKTVLCSFQTPGEKTSVRIAKVLEGNKGETVQSIGTIEVPEE